MAFQFSVFGLCLWQHGFFVDAIGGVRSLFCFVLKLSARCCRMITLVGCCSIRRFKRCHLAMKKIKDDDQMFQLLKACIPQTHLDEIKKKPMDKSSLFVVTGKEGEAVASDLTHVVNFAVLKALISENPSTIVSASMATKALLKLDKSHSNLLSKKQGRFQTNWAMTEATLLRQLWQKLRDMWRRAPTTSTCDEIANLKSKLKANPKAPKPKKRRRIFLNRDPDRDKAEDLKLPEFPDRTYQDSDEDEDEESEPTEERLREVEEEEAEANENEVEVVDDDDDHDDDDHLKLSTCEESPKKPRWAARVLEKKISEVSVASSETNPPQTDDPKGSATLAIPAPVRPKDFKPLVGGRAKVLVNKKPAGIDCGGAEKLKAWRTKKAKAHLKELPKELQPSNPLREGQASYRVHSPNQQACIEVHVVRRLFWLVKSEGEAWEGVRYRSWDDNVLACWKACKKEMKWK